MKRSTQATDSSSTSRSRSRVHIPRDLPSARTGRPSERAPRPPLDLAASLSSRDLTSGLQGRDPASVAAFFELTADRVEGLVRSEVRDEETARDLAQEIYLNLVRGLPSYDTSRPLEPWVHTVARNRLRDYWRSAVHREQSNADDGDAEGGDWFAARASGQATPDDLAERREQGALLRAAVDALPESLREAVRLRVFEGLSFEEAGERLGRTAAAVRKRYSRALETLRSRLGAFPFDNVVATGVQVASA